MHQAAMENYKAAIRKKNKTMRLANLGLEGLRLVCR
jgi:hypothetical protein